MNHRQKLSGFEYVRCDLCGGDRTELYRLTQSRYSEDWLHVVRCADCGLIYVNPRPVDKELLIRRFSNDRSLAASRQETFSAPVIERNYLLARIRLMQIQKLLPRGRLLDFGCGNGTFVFTALAEGWDAIGIDLNEGLIAAANRFWKGERLGEGWNKARLELSGMIRKAVARHRERDLLFSVSAGEYAREHAGSFDIINSSQVLEHLVSPSHTADLLSSMLKRNGWLIADVPNVRCWREITKRGSTLDPTAHLYYFNRSTIRRLLEARGMEVVSISTRMSFLGVWAALLTPLGLKHLIPRVTHGMSYLPDLGLSSFLVVVARKR